MWAMWRFLTARAETWRALSLSLLVAAPVGVGAGFVFGRDWSTVLQVTAAVVLALGVGGAMRLLWSRSAPAARTLDQLPPPQRLD